MYGMNMRKNVDSYRQAGMLSEVQVADPHRLVQMLFEGALERIAVAKGAMKAGNIAYKGERIGKAIDIIDSLRSMLDDKHNPELAERLAALYSYMLRRLTEANLYNDPERLDEVSKLLREIKAGWDEIPPEYRNASSARAS